jgi:hypothetical protein
MGIALAATFDPRGEIGRLQRLYAQLQMPYSYIVISLPPKARPDEVDQLRALSGAQVIVNTAWSQGRYTALKAAYGSGADYIHYADLDRLIRWVETRPDEWLQTVERVQQSDCLIIGRTEAAWATHPQVMIQVEKIINSTFSHFLGQDFDFGAGSKGFSRRAAGVILANCQPDNPLGADIEWPILLHRVGFSLQSVLADGLDWEIPDQYQDQAADRERQRTLAEAYDADVQRWKYRVGSTVEVFASGLDALQRPLVEG